MNTIWPHHKSIGTTIIWLFGKSTSLFPFRLYPFLWTIKTLMPVFFFMSLQRSYLNPSNLVCSIFCLAIFVPENVIDSASHISIAVSLLLMYSRWLSSTRQIIKFLAFAFLSHHSFITALLFAPWVPVGSGFVVERTQEHFELLKSFLPDISTSRSSYRRTV